MRKHLLLSCCMAWLLLTNSNGIAADETVKITPIGWRAAAGESIAVKMTRNVRVPEITTTGLASLQLTSAWIAGHPVRITVQ